MMTAYLLSLDLLLTLSVYLTAGRTISEEIRVVEASSGGSVTLPCTAKNKPNVQYTAVSWYKQRGNQPFHRQGLLRRDLPGGTAIPYLGADREMVLLNESHDIVLSHVMCNDSGPYLCDLAAPVGEQNRDGEVFLRVTDCPIDFTLVSRDFDSPPVSRDFDSTPVSRDFEEIHPEENQMRDNLVIFASAMLMVAFFMSLIGYCCVKSAFREKSQKLPVKEILLDAPVKPLEKKDLQLIYTLGPKTSTLKHVFV